VIAHSALGLISVYHAVFHSPVLDHQFIWRDHRFIIGIQTISIGSYVRLLVFKPFLCLIVVLSQVIGL
jgi:hypothetical protein